VVAGNLRAIGVGMDVFSCARIICNSQRCAPVLSSQKFLHKAKGQLLVLLKFYQQINFFGVNFVEVSEERVI